MPQQVTDVDVMRDYLRGVMNRADHHAQQVNEIALAVAGGVIWRKNDDPLEVMVREGDMKNVLWFKVNDQRFTLSYNHGTSEIELRRGTTQGSIIASFSNATTASQVRTVFGNL
jgi:hypothetical protein